MKTSLKKIAVFLFFIGLITVFALFDIFATEKTDVLGLQKIPLTASFAPQGEKLQLSWKPLPYPCFYKVETFYKSTGKVKGTPEYRLVHTDFTEKADCTIVSTMIPTYYRITAYGFFGTVSGPTQPIPHPNFASPTAPTTIFKYTKDHPASPMPYLVWHGIPNAVCYEVEILSGKPENEQGAELSTQHHLFSTHDIFTNGFQADLSAYQQEKELYWRVRALNIHHEPIGVFSKAEPIFIDPQQPVPDKPLLNDFDQVPNFHQPLYPVYHWIPMHGIKRYEVELMTKPPAKENNTEPTPDRAWSFQPANSFSCYDEYARPYAGPYYWRVRAIDAQGNTIGHYSDTDSFVVEEHKDRILAATFGDSITHGGGAVSNSPASLEYSYTTYLDFAAMNLGKSGDTAHTSLLRFDADVLPYHPYNLLILTGSNSLRADTPAENVIADLEAIRKKCEENDIRPIFLTLMPINPENIRFAFHTGTDPSWHQKLLQVNAYIRSQPYFIDLEPYFYDVGGQYMPSLLATDGLHPDTTGKQLMGEIINQHMDVLRKK